MSALSSTTTPPTPGLDAERFLRTDDVVQDLRQRAVFGSLVTAVAQGGKFALNLGSAAVLARLLTPHDFGLVGMVLAITSLVGLFKEAGLSMATVQTETITQRQVSNLFWLNVGLGAAATVISVALAPAVARFYRDPRLSAIMVVLSLVFLMAGAMVQHQALLIRKMRFRAIAVIELASLLAGILTACGLALGGLTYWALVAQQLVVAATALVLTWYASGWRPTMPTRRSGMAPLVRFGAHLTVSDLIARLAASSDTILVGRVFGAEPLGLYSRAGVLLARPLEQLLTPISAVLIPVLSRLQSDPARYRRTFLRAYDTLALVTFPFTALCLVLAHPLVVLVLGPKWTGVVPLFAGFTLVALSLPLLLATSWLYLSQGRGHDLLLTYVVLSFVTVAAFVIGLSWGPLGVVLALAVASLVIRQPILFHLAGRRGPVSTGDLWGGFLAHLPCWGAVYVAATMARQTVEDAAPLVQLLVCAPVALAAMGAVVLALPRPRRSASYAWTVSLRVLLRGRRSRPPHAPRIALFGIFGLQNLGNECTLYAMAHNVRERRPDADVYCVCYGPGETVRRHDLPSIAVGTSPATPASGRGPMRRVLRIVLRWLPAELAHGMRAFRTLRQTHLLVMTGTGMLTDYGTSALAYPYDVLKWTALAKVAGCKVRFVSIGVGVLDGRLSRCFVRWALRLADYRSYRDDVSKSRAAQLGLDVATDPVFPDLAFSLPTSILPASAEERRQRVVGVAVMNHFQMQGAGHAEGRVAHEAYLEKMADFTAWVAGRGYGVRILQGDAKYDAPVRRDFQTRLEQRGLAYGPGGIVDEDSASFDQLLTQIVVSDVVVSPRFHNLILALMLDKSVISISYDRKNDALLEGFDLGRYCQAIERLDVERLIQQFLEIEAGLDLEDPRRRHRAEEYRRRLDAQYELVLADV